jgi:hypothetical protein
MSTRNELPSGSAPCTNPCSVARVDPPAPARDHSVYDHNADAISARGQTEPWENHSGPGERRARLTRPGLVAIMAACFARSLARLRGSLSRRSSYSVRRGRPCMYTSRRQAIRTLLFTAISNHIISNRTNRKARSSSRALGASSGWRAPSSTSPRITPTLGRSSRQGSRRSPKFRPGQRRRSTRLRRFTARLAAIPRSAALPPSSPDLI